MLAQSKEVRDAWRSSQRTLDIKVVVGDKTYNATDINSLKYDSGAYTGDTFSIGSTYSNSVEIEFSHLVENLKLGMKVLPSIGIKTSSGYVYEPLGVFIISSEIKMDRNNNLTTINASDRFCGLEGVYKSKLNYPAKVVDVIAEICGQAGVKANTDDLARLPHQEDLPAPITGQTYRKALGWIAQLYAGYAAFDRQGLFTIRTIAEPNYELDPGQYEQGGLTKNEAPYKINGIQCQVTVSTKTRDGEDTEETKTFQIGDATGSQIKLENNIMTGARLNAIWEEIKDITFYPYSLNWFGNPAIEAGDWLRLTDKQGNSFVVPNNGYTLDFNGGLSATSKADQSSSTGQAIAWQGTVAQAINELKARKAPDGTVIFPPSVTEPPRNAKFNDVWFKKNGNATELWVFEKQDDGSGKWVRKDLADGEVLKQVEEAQKGLNQAKADIITNKQKADQDIENLNKSIEDNKKVADKSLQKLNDSVTNLQGQYDNNVVPNLNKVMADASDALQKYITAQNSIADLTKQAQAQGKNIAEVTKTVDGLNINYANLAGDVNSTKVDVKGLQTTLGTANGDIAQLKLDAHNLQALLASKVDNSTYTNFVNLTNQALNAKLTASDLTGYAKTTDLQATASGLKLNIDSVNDRMNNLKIGAVNQLRNTDPTDSLLVGEIAADKWVCASSGNGYGTVDNLGLPFIAKKYFRLRGNTSGNKDFNQRPVNWENSVYSFSIYARLDPDTLVKNATGYIRSWSVKQSKAVFQNKFTIDSKKWKKFTFEIDASSFFDDETASFAFGIEGYGSIDFAEPMLTTGEILTDWSPNPLDTEHSLTELSARINTNSQQFSSYYTKSETDAKANTAKNDAVNVIKSDGNWQGLNNILTNAGFLQTADGFLQKVQQTTVPMFSGGGVNLARGTSDKWSSAWNNFNGKSNQTKQLGRFYTRNLNVGDWITISVNYQYQNLSGSGMQIALQADGNVCDWENGAIYPGDWQHLQASSTLKTGSIERHIKVTSSLIQNEYYEVQLRVDNASSGWLQWIYFQVNKGTVRPPWAPAPEDMATQSAFSELSQSLEGLRSTVGSNYGNLQSQISQSSSTIRTDLTNKINGVQNQVTTTADGLNAKIGAIQIGGRNYLRNSDKSITGGVQDLGTIPNEVLNELAGKTITVSCDVEWSGYAHDNSKRNRLGFEASVIGSDGHRYWLGAWKSPTIPSGKERISTQYTLPAGVTFTVNNNGKNGYVQIKGSGSVSHAKIEIGNRMTDWSPAPEDSEEKFVEVNATINGLRSTISNNYGTLNSQIDQTASTIRQEVNDHVNGLQSQITANANSFDVSLKKVQQTDGVNILRGTRDFSGDWDNLNNWYKDNWVDPNGNYAIKRKGAWGGAAQKHWLETGTYTFSFYYYFEGSDSSTGAWVYVAPNNDATIKVTENNTNSLEITKDKWMKKVYTFTVTTPGTSAVRVETNSNTATIHVGSYKLEKGYKETPWTANPQDAATKIYTSVQDLNNLRTAGNYVIRATNNPNSPISNWLVVRVDGTGDRLHQTISADNNPNLSYTRTYNGSWSDWQRTVTGGNIMAQINMSAGTTLIQNDKIYMDSSSTIFSGKAFIPDAAITNISADKITAGTLDAGRINVVNLNANNITAGTLKGSNGQFYLDSGALHVWQSNHDAWIDQNGIHDYDNQGNNVWIKKGGVGIYGNMSSVDIRNGSIFFNMHTAFDKGVLAADYGSITKSDNVVSFGTSGLDITGTDGFILRTKNWNDQTLAYMNANPINGAGISANTAGFMNVAAKKQLYLYAGDPLQGNGIKTLPHLLLDSTNGNGQTVLSGTFSQYSFGSVIAGFNGGLQLQNDSASVGSLDNKNYLALTSNNASIYVNGKSVLSLGGIFPGVQGDFNVNGNFSVTGSKNAIVSTSRGMAAINAYETAEYYFGDIGEAVTNSDGELTVMIDPFFLETVNTLVPYQVFLTPYGNGNVWVSSRSANNFTVKSSNPNIHFAWEIKAKRKGYENDRMKIVKGVFNNEQY